MHLFQNLKVPHKLLLVAFLSVIATVVVGVVGIVSLGNVNESLRTIYLSNVRGLEVVSYADTQVRAIQVSALTSLLMADSAGAAALEQEVRGYADGFNQAMSEYRALVSHEEGRAVADQVLPDFARYVTLVQEAIGMALAGAKQEEILPMVARDIGPLRANLNERMAELLAVESEQARVASEAAERSYTSTSAFLLACMLGTALVTFGLSYFISRMITRPLQLVVDGTGRLAEGDLTQSLGYQGRDELGVAARGFDRALEGLRNLVASVRDHTEHVASSSQELASSAEEVGRSVSQVAESVDQIARGGQQQSDAATTTSRIVRQIAEAVQQVTAATQSMVNGAGEASRLAQEGRSALDAMVGRMDQIQSSVGESGAAVQNLGERSQRIGQIVDAITGIAEQTNLLALNAAIEAARAGDQGRGFAVVAEEVRKLAQESGKAASEIAELVAEIRQEVERAVRDTQAGAGTVAEGVEAVRVSGKTFQAITRTLEKMVQQIHEANTATERMAASSDHAIRSVDEIAAITQENATMTEAVASATEEQTAAVAHISGAATDLANLAQELARAVAAFKV